MRQKPIGHYIADFYCAKAGLIVELDGSGHYEPKAVEKDAKRTKELENKISSIYDWADAVVLGPGLGKNEICRSGRPDII